MNDEAELSRVKAWSSSIDGEIMIGGQALRSLKPKHYHQFLLQEDKFGILCPSEIEIVAESGRSKKRSSDDISPLRAKAQRIAVSFPNLKMQNGGPGSGVSSDDNLGHASSDEPEIDSALRHPMRSSVSRDQSQSSIHERQSLESTVTSPSSTTTPDSHANEQPDSGRSSPSLVEAGDGGESRSESAASNRSNVEPPKAVQSDTNSSGQGEHQSPPQPAACDTVVSAMQSATSVLPSGATDKRQRTGSPDLPQVESDERETQPTTDNVRDDAQIVLAATDAPSVASNEDNPEQPTDTRPDLLKEGVVNIAVFPTGLSDTQKSKLQHWAEVAHAIPKSQLLEYGVKERGQSQGRLRRHHIETHWHCQRPTRCAPDVITEKCGTVIEAYKMALCAIDGDEEDRMMTAVSSAMALLNSKVYRSVARLIPVIRAQMLPALENSRRIVLAAQQGGPAKSVVSHKAEVQDALAKADETIQFFLDLVKDVTEHYSITDV